MTTDKTQYARGETVRFTFVQLNKSSHACNVAVGPSCYAPGVEVKAEGPDGSYQTSDGFYWASYYMGVNDCPNHPPETTTLAPGQSYKKVIDWDQKGCLPAPAADCRNTYDTQAPPGDYTAAATWYVSPQLGHLYSPYHQFHIG